MATPVLGSLKAAAAAAAKKKFSTKLGRTLYRNAKGRLVSFQTYKKLREDAVMSERRKRATWGKPPRGYTWVRLANKYPDRFAAYS